jgi:hypothetical protein
MLADRIISQEKESKMKSPLFILIILAFVGSSISGCSPAPTAALEHQVEIPWTQSHITSVPPIMMRDPFLELLGQTTGPLAYTYEEAVKLSGHSCGAVAGAWTITRKALEALYPGETPVRGQILVQAPGAENEWHVGVFGEVITYITGAAPKTGFSGSEFAKGDDIFVRRDKMTYTEEPTGTAPPMMEWVFTRADTGKSVGVKFNVMAVQPLATEERTAMGVKMASGAATPEEAADYVKYWNDRVDFIFANADSMDGLFILTIHE